MVHVSCPFPANGPLCCLLDPLLERISQFFLTKVEMWLQGQTMDQLLPGMVAWADAAESSKRIVALPGDPV